MTRPTPRKIVRQLKRLIPWQSIDDNEMDFWGHFRYGKLRITTRIALWKLCDSYWVSDSDNKLLFHVRLLGPLGLKYEVVAFDVGDWWQQLWRKEKIEMIADACKPNAPDLVNSDR